MVGAGIDCGACRRAARRRRAIHQPGLFLLPAGRPPAGPTRAGSLADRAQRAGRLLGLSRLEGHAGAARQFHAPERIRAGARRSRGLHAAGRDQRHGARARQRQGRDRRRHRQDAPRGRSAQPAGEPEVAHGIIVVGVPAATGSKRSGEVWLCPVTGKVACRSGAGRTVAALSSITTWCGAGSSSVNGTARRETFDVKLDTLADARFSLADIDRAAVLLQSGSATQRPA